MEQDAGRIADTAYMDSPLGLIELRAGAAFLQSVVFVEERKFPETEHPLLAEAKQQLSAYFDNRLTQFDLPLGQPGTGFQQRVWKELVAIPFGKTISYLDLAKRLGDPKVIRAAGLANGKNNIAIIVPCHRVIGSDGSLTGYAGGLWRKEWLLRHEREQVHGKQETLFG